MTPSPLDPDIPCFAERVKAELTRDVVFLFQVRHRRGRREDWDTERVFLSREEGEAFGKATHYRYSDGWRVYGVPAEGLLAGLLVNT